MSHEHWDRHHSTHDHSGDERHSSSQGELAGFLAGLPQRPRHALDIGCGTGADAVYLAGLGIETTGVDVSARALELARARSERADVAVSWLEGSALQLPLGDGSIDLALDRGCLHHLSDDEQRRYAVEVARVLAPGGVLLVREMNEAGRHEHAVTEASIRAMVAGSSLRVRSTVTYDTPRGDRAGRTLLVVLEQTQLP